MLDTTTKKRIDDCRDILVGKLPDPKAQIEQITIGLIYKFMDDMDKEAVELGGKTKFFSNYMIPDPENPGKEKLVEFEKYSWDRLFDAKVTASEMLTLYSEAIVSMDKNPNIPQLFRDIFKNAYLPYRDPETLKMFLKTISEFEYTHSEKLGDAFEYLLSVMGSQGEAGQFRTPRHIIDFLVAVVGPQKTDTILDPACGTAGFLISAFKYMMNGGDTTPDERRRIIGNFTGYDISPDMVRLSLVNLYLHGFSDPHIHEYDTLSSEERWKETYDVILANPPFMSPKGGIRPHKKFSISSNRSEVLFVDYIAEHLNPKGRAGIIVPEGVIFQSGTAYKDLRKMLVDNYLYAVVSLPAGVFNPYSGVKTSILLMDKAFAKTCNEILFVKIDNDGFGLGAQRNAVKGGQLDEAIEVIRTFVQNHSENSINYPTTAATIAATAHATKTHQTPTEPTKTITTTTIAHAVPKSEIANLPAGKAGNGDYNLSGERYKTNDEFRISNYEFVSLENVAVLQGGYAFKSVELKSEQNHGEFPVVKIGSLTTDGKVDLSNSSYFPFDNSLEKFKIKSGDFLVAMTGATVGKSAISQFDNLLLNQRVGLIRKKSNNISQRFLDILLLSEWFYDYCQKTAGGGAQGNISPKDILSFEIPLPPISVQEEIVAEIEGYQKIIDGAKMVVDNYKPKIDIDPDWEMVELGEVCESISDGDHQPPPKSEDGVPFVTISNIDESEGVDFSNTFFVPKSYYENIKSHRKPKIGDILYTVTGSFGIPILINFEKEFCFQRHIGLIRPNSRVINSYLYYYLQTPDAFAQAMKTATGMAQKTVSLNSLRSFIIPIPPFEIQRQIVSRIEKEQELVNANKQLIEIFGQKIKERIARVWGVDTSKLGVSTPHNQPELLMAAEPKSEYKPL
ncbi:MAG: hypothetical protein FD181_3097 [Prolixibacteraceae bacterium]|nr:MAG: hypothetical protein FD181_3097 [Prolixibacteraceae bacterium]